MAIKRSSLGKYISEPGEYVVTVDSVEMTKTKAGKIDKKTGTEKPQYPMVVVHFLTSEGQQIAGYYCKQYAFQMKDLADLKKSCGIGADKLTEELMGKSCGILVEMGPTSPETGRSFAQIIGYGSVSEVVQDPEKGIVDGFDRSQQAQEDVPF